MMRAWPLTLAICILTAWCLWLQMQVYREGAALAGTGLTDLRLDQAERRLATSEQRLTAAESRLAATELRLRQAERKLGFLP